MKNLYARIVLLLIRPALMRHERAVVARGNEVLKAQEGEAPAHQLFALGEISPGARRPFWPDEKPW